MLNKSKNKNQARINIIFYFNLFLFLAELILKGERVTILENEKK